MPNKNFALLGAAGYVAPRHMKAITDTGNNLVAALDPSDSVGCLDQFGYDIQFFTEFERFDRYAEKLRRSGDTAVYRDILAGGGYGMQDARPAINLVYELRNAKPVIVPLGDDQAHRFIDPERRRDISK